MSRRLAGLAVILVLMIVPTQVAAQGESPRKVERQLARGHRALDDHRYEDALELFDRARETSGDTSFAARLGVAQATLALGRYEESAEVGRETLELAESPLDEARSHTAIGQAFFAAREGAALTEDAMKRLEQRERVLRSAERAFRHALDLAGPEVPEASYALGFLLLERGEFDEGLTQLRLYTSTLADPEIARYYGCIDGVASSGTVAAVFGADARPLRDRFDPPPGGRSFVSRTEVVKYLVDANGEIACIITLGGAGMSRIDEFLERIRAGLAMEPVPPGAVPIAELRTLEITLGPSR